MYALSASRPPLYRGRVQVSARQQLSPGIAGPQPGGIHVVGTGSFDPFKLWTLIAGSPTPRIRHQKQCGPDTTHAKPFEL